MYFCPTLNGRPRPPGRLTDSNASMNHTISRLLRLAVLAALPAALSAQPGRTTLLDSQIKTLRLAVNGQPEAFPVIELGGSDVLNVSFDDMTHEYRRFTYKIEHADPEGRVTDGLFDTEYVQATTDEEVIDDYANSLNTTVLYTHYSFSLPNAHVRPLLSGNYLLTVSVENDEGEAVPVVRTCFGVVERKVSLALSATTDTETDRNDTQQQLSMRVDMGNLPMRDADSEVKTLVMQNRRYDTARYALSPTAQNGSKLIWEHDRRLIFPAGNEYRKMEMLSTRYPGQHGESVRWYDPYYHYTLMTDYPRRNYLYDEDRNGLYVARWEGSGDEDTEADYVVTHFTLEMPRLDHTAVYVGGRFAPMDYTPDHRMAYNEERQCYELSLLLKTGYYNYMYFCRQEGGSQSVLTAQTEGDYFQTENEYDALVYYRPTGARYWQLVGCITPTYRP